MSHETSINGVELMKVCRTIEKLRTDAAVISQMEQIHASVMKAVSCRNYQLDDSTIMQLDDWPFPLSSYPQCVHIGKNALFPKKSVFQ